MLEELAVIVTEIVVTAAMIEAMIEGAMTGVMIGAMVVVEVVDTEEVVVEVEENLAGWQSELLFYKNIHWSPFIMLCLVSTWVKVFRIISEFRILRLTFHRKSASKF